MRKQSTTEGAPSRIVWDNLEEWARGKVQEFIQSLLREEVTELLGRKKSQRRKAVDSSPVYRNGYGKGRRLTLGCGTVKVRRARVRGLEGRFQSRVLPLFARRTKEVSELIPQLYLHGLALGDFDVALKGLLGEEVPVSAATLARLVVGRAGSICHLVPERVITGLARRFSETGTGWSPSTAFQRNTGSIYEQPT